MNFCITNQFRNESHRLEEWVLYHLHQGFDSFILFDDFSEDDSVEKLNTLKSKYGINIIVEKTDGKGAKFKNSSETNSYNGNGQVASRVARSATKGIEIARNINPDCVIFIGEVDEFLHTPLDIKISDLILNLQNEHSEKHLYIQSYDVCDEFNFDSWITCQEVTANRWSHEFRKNTIFHDRGKSITTPKTTNKVAEEGGHIHYLTTGDYRSFPESKRIDPNILRIHHFRKPSYLRTWNKTDDSLLVKSRKIKTFYQK